MQSLDDVFGCCGAKRKQDKRNTKRHCALIKHDMAASTETEIVGYLSCRARKWGKIRVSVPKGLSHRMARNLYSMRVRQAAQVIARDWWKRGQIYDWYARVDMSRCQ